MNKNTTSLKNPLLSENSLKNLNLILSNIKLGEKHLRRHLDWQKIKSLLEVGGSKKSKKRLQADLEEKSGDIIRRLLAILTGGLGAWMGIKDFLFQGQYQSSQLIWTTIIIIFISSIIGFLSYRSTTIQAKRSCFNHDMVELQAIILDEMISRQKGRVKNLKNKLSRLLGKLGFDQKMKHAIKDFYSQTATSEIKEIFLSQLDNVFKKKWEKVFDGPTEFPSYLKRKFSNLKKIITKRVEVKSSEQSMDLDENNELILILSKAVSTAPKPSLKFSSWLMTQINSILIELLPALFGTFGSMFVFLTGVPGILKEMGIVESSEFFTKPEFKYLLLALAILFTVYLGISQCKVIYKSWLRSKAIEKAQITISEKELKYRDLMYHVSYLKKSYEYCLDINEYIEFRNIKLE